VLAIAAEEGDGKTLWAEQLARQMLRGDRLFGLFDLGDARPARVLFVDTEMEEDDAKERDDDMNRRGLAVGAGQFFWWSPGGLVLDDEMDFAALAAEVRRVRPDVVWIDSGINAVSDAEDGTAVKALFNNLSKLMRQHALVGIGLTLHTRKRAQGQNDRRFDDLFGSREWKGRLGTMLYMEGNKITVWKNRGGRLRRVFKSEAGKRPWAVLERPGLNDDASVPFIISVPADDDQASAAELEQSIIAMLQDKPATYAKTALAENCGKRKTDALALIKRMQDDGRIVPKDRGAKLSLADPDDDAPVSSAGRGASDWNDFRRPPGD
jgi:hypothetical protein